MGPGAIDPSEQIAEIDGRIVACTICPRLVEYRERVARTKRRMYRDADYWGRPLPGFGDPQARLLLVGLAPAAHGGNRTGRMFTGDRSGDWLYGALHKFGFANQPTSLHRDDGLSLKDAYVTAAIRCAPPANKPLREELLSCRPYLLAELASLTRLRVVVALGRIAFDSYLAAYRVFLGADAPPSPKPTFSHGGVSPLPNGVTLVSSYHPSQQNTQTGRLTTEMFHSVFATVRRLLDGDGLPDRRSMTRDQEQMAQEFIKRIDREVVPKQLGAGYSLRRPDGTHYRFGYIRYNIAGPNAGKYCVQAIGSYRDDPQGKFESANSPNWAQWYVSPSDEDGVRYAVQVLESCYDHAGK